MRVQNIVGRSGNAVRNQFIINMDNGDVVFQSYRTIIAKKTANGVLLDSDSWDYSVTTGKYRNQFLGESKAETEKKIKSGEYKLANLN